MSRAVPPAPAGRLWCLPGLPWVSCMRSTLHAILHEAGLCAAQNWQQGWHDDMVVRARARAHATLRCSRMLRHAQRRMQASPTSLPCSRRALCCVSGSSWQLHEPAPHIRMHSLHTRAQHCGHSICQSIHIQPLRRTNRDRYSRPFLAVAQGWALARKHPARAHTLGSVDMPALRLGIT